MRIEVDMKLVLKYYIPMLLLLIPAMFLLNASAFKEGKALVVVGLYALVFLVLFANLVFIQILYRVKSKKIVKATTYLSVILNAYPLFYMVITNTTDLLVLALTFFYIAIFVFVMFDRLW